MWLLPCVTSHVYHQHVLGFKGFLLSGAAIPVASEVLAIFLDVVSVDMFDQIILCFKQLLTFLPMASQISLLILLSLILFSFIVWAFLLLCKKLVKVNSQDLISNPSYCLPHSSCDVSLENLLLDQLRIPKLIFSLFSSLVCLIL